MSELTVSICNDAFRLASSPLIKSIVVVKLCMGLGAAFSVAVWFRRRGSSWIPNPNAKLLYLLHLYFAFHAAAFFLFAYIYQLIKSSLPSSDPCFYAYNARLACAIRLIPVLAVHGQSVNMFTFAVERAISTIFSKRYEQVSRPFLAAFLVLVTIVCTLLMDYFCYFEPISKDTYEASFAIRNPDNAKTFQYVVNSALILELLTVSVFLLTYLVNVKKGRSRDLGDQYQISENKKIIRILFPCFMLHCILNVSSYFCLSIYPLFFTYNDPVTASAFTELVGHPQNYGLFMPWILLWQTRKRYRVQGLDAEAATRAHFETLRKLFNE